MIWYVEDDSNIRDIGMYALNSQGFETLGFEDGASFLDALKEKTPDLVILDVMLPEMDGVSILKKMKNSKKWCNIPVIMATAKSHEYDRIKSLDLGADDYIVKPFSVMEMVSRVKAVLRRTKPQQENKIIKMGELELNKNSRIFSINNEKIPLTYKEFELLNLFMSYPENVFTREQLFFEVWQTDYMGDSRTLDAHIKSLRHKLKNYGKMIKTVRNVGYRWEINDDDQNI